MLEKICTSLEISKKLKEAGFFMPQFSRAHYIEPHNMLNCALLCSDEYTSYHTLAYTFEEIFNHLPEMIEGEALYFSKNRIGYFDSDKRIEKKDNENLADTAARLWLKLKEESLV